MIMATNPREDPVVVELTATLREWHKIWLSLYLDNQTELFDRIGLFIEELVDFRLELITLLKHSINSSANEVSSNTQPVAYSNSTAGQIHHQHTQQTAKCIQSSPPMSASSSEQQVTKLKSDIVAKLDHGNRLLGLDLVPRDSSYKIVDPIELSPIKLFQVHHDAANLANSLHGSNNTYSGHASIVSTSALSTISQYSTDSCSTTATSTTTNNNNSATSQVSSHLQMCLRNNHSTLIPPEELVEVYFCIVDAFSSNSSSNNNNITSPTLKPVTEKFLVQLKNNEIVCGLPNTVFTNLGPLHNRELCLLVHVYRQGKMMLAADGYRTAFSKQSSSQELTSSNQDGSSNSISSQTKYTPNGLSTTRNRQSAAGYLDPTPKYKRPFGAALIPLKDYAKSSDFKDSPLQVKIVAQSDSEFGVFNELYPKRTLSLKGNQNLPNINLDLSIRFISSAQDSLTKLTTVSPLCLTEKRGFPDIIMPGDFKNDLYFNLDGAEFEKGGKSISKNIEASISLIDKSGFVIEKCVSPASNCDNVSIYKSCIFYHSNSPKWADSVKINVPLCKFDSAHIRIEFRHCSTKDREKKFLGFSFLPLIDDEGAVIADKSHDLYIYKCDFQIWEDESLNLCKYTSLPYGPAAKPPLHHHQTSAKSNGLSNFTHSNRELVTVSTFLLSTKLTQNRNLLNLLKWRELIKRNNKDFEEALKRVLDLRGEEIVQFLQDILDTLFDTFTLYSTSEDDYCALIFKVLVHIFLLLDDPKYQHFKPVLDTYASAHFSATLVYKGLLACVKECLGCSSIVERHVPIQKCFKSIKYVFQFIVQSKLLFSKATGEQSDELFINDLRHLFHLFEALLSNSNPKLIPVQVTFLESFPGTIEQLLRILSGQELARVVTNLAGSVGFKLPPSLARAKLVFMRECASTSLVRNQEIRMQIAENFCRHIDCCIRHSEELDLCYEVLETLIVRVHEYHWPSIHRLHLLSAKSRSTSNHVNSSVTIAATDSTCMGSPQCCPLMTVSEISSANAINQMQANQLDLAIINVSREIEPYVHLMEPLCALLNSLFKDFNTDRYLIQKYCTCLLTVLKLMSALNFEMFMKKRKMDYMELCTLLRSFRAVYNRDWSIMQMTSHSILEHPIDIISKSIMTKIDSPAHSRPIVSYIKLIVDFVTHPTLQLEAFSARKKAYTLLVFGDLRLKFGAQLMRFWSQLSNVHICELIPTTIQPLLDATLLPNDPLQSLLMPMFWDMIKAEETLKSNCKHLERCLIDNLDLFMNLDRGNTKFVHNFESIMARKLDESCSPEWDLKGPKLVATFTHLMRLLIDYRQSLDGGTDNRSRQMSCLMQLLNFHKDQGRTDLHLKYLFKLSEMHLEAANYTEAAFTLKLYTDELKFCKRNLSLIDGFRPEELEWKRKEALYQRIIQYFDIGKCWEEAIPMCKDLAAFYENFLVDYERVSATLKKLAHFLDNILAEHRPEREYFRVEFLGLDMMAHVRGKEHIFRGHEYERLATFIQRISSDYPGAHILNPKSRQLVTNDTPGAHILVSTVKPRPSHEHLKSGQRNINGKIIQYYLNNRLDTFTYDTPIIRPTNSSGEPDQGSTAANLASSLSASTTASGELNVKNLWVGRTILKLAKQLPGILPWQEVVSKEYIEINPIDHAIETISNMNVELTNLIISYKKEPNKPISPLTMRLQGIIEAAVNGGPSLFISAFLKRNTSNSQQHHGNNEDETGSRESPCYDPESSLKLRNAMKQQFSLLQMGLDFHAKLVPPEVMPLHNRLVERMHSIRKNLADELMEQNCYETVAPPANNNPGGVSPLDGAPVGRPSIHCKPSAGVGVVKLGLEQGLPTMVLGTGGGGASSPAAALSPAARDEVDGGHDVNGNLYSDLDDQIYSQPANSNASATAASATPARYLHQACNGGTKSELSSPSRGPMFDASTSCSLSTLAVLSNLPVNRSRLSVTPTRGGDVCGLASGGCGATSGPGSPHTLHRTSMSSLSNSDLCARAARKLTYDPPARALDGGGPTNGEAPPLPPRSFLHDKHALTNSLNRSAALLGSSRPLQQHICDRKSAVFHPLNGHNHPKDSLQQQQQQQQPPSVISMSSVDSAARMMQIVSLNEPKRATATNSTSSLPRLVGAGKQASAASLTDSMAPMESKPAPPTLPARTYSTTDNGFKDAATGDEPLTCQPSDQARNGGSQPSSSRSASPQAEDIVLPMAPPATPTETSN